MTDIIRRIPELVVAILADRLEANGFKATVLLVTPRHEVDSLGLEWVTLDREVVEDGPAAYAFTDGDRVVMQAHFGTAATLGDVA